MVNVIWYRNARGNWDHGLLMEIFDKNPKVFDQYQESEIVNADRAIIIVTGVVDPVHLKDYLSDFKSGIVIFTSDEEARWDISAIVPEHLEIWSQYYKPGMKVSERLLMGQPNRLKDYKINKTKEKKYLWSFVGQVQNPFRQQCVDVLKKLPDGFLRTTDLFGGVCDKAIEYQEYLDIMCQSKYVICPSGSFTPESFRLYEAMECGAIPITDARAPVHSKDFNYWNNVYRWHKLITLNFWEEGTLKEIMTLPNSNDWWFTYKKGIEEKLIEYANG